ncbi:MAG: ABC transporter ATP-binding protein/permease [Lentisphaeraceae bacterium]|nr:ABC transporter ATP-binding protein/permease [Lentisphaeraceae bacterium]
MVDQEELSENKERLTKSSFKVLFRLWSVLMPYKWILIVANLFCVTYVVADIYLVDAIAELAGRKDLQTENIFTLVSLVFIFALVNRICGFSQFYMAIFATNKGMIDLRCKFFDALMSQSKSFYDKHKVGWLVARGTGDMGYIYDFLAFALMIIMLVVTYLGLIGSKMLAMAPRLILVCSLVVLVGTVFVYFIQKVIRERVEAQSKQNSRMVAYMAESIRGVKVIQAFAREDYNLHTYMNYNRENVRLSLRVIKMSGVLIPSMDVLGILGIISIMSYGSYLIESGYIMPSGDALNAGHLAASVLYMNMLLMPIRMCIDIYNMSISASTAARRVFEVIDMAPSVKDPENPKLPEKIIGNLAFDSVDFKYNNDGPMIIADLNLEIPSGQSVAIVGKTGAGKTTVAHLAARFYDPVRGEIMLDGQNLNDFKQDDLHKNMAIVLQDGFLFSGNVLDNIRFRRPELSQEEVEELCKKLGTYEIISSLPDGFLTEIHEGGETLSVGQRQIISLSRALAADPKLLILDEATSAIDVYTEAVLEKALRKLIKGRTTIIIAHRLSTIRNVDRILVMKNGVIIEQGSHDELVQKAGEYAQMVNSGMKEE